MRRQGSGTTCRCRPRSGEPKASERHPSFFWYRAEVPMPESMVEVAKVTKVYQRGKQKIEVLHGLDLDIPKGDFVALMGPSGSGKTTLLNLIGGLDQPTSGEVRVGGSRIDQLGSGELARWRAHNVGFVFQFYNLMQVLNREHGKTIVIVTHDPKAAEFARRILHLEKGQLLEQARAA